MSPLRQRMIENMKLAGLSPTTQAVYIKSVRGLAAHYHRSPDQLSEEEVRSYLLGMRERGVARGTFKASHYGIQFLYRNTLSRDWSLFSKKRSAVRNILPRLRNPIYRACSTVIYACGLRAGEGTGLEIRAIDGVNRLLRIIGKGNKERVVPL